MINKIIYEYKKKHRYLDPLLQDMIASKTGFIPYKIKLLTASKTNKLINEFNEFTFIYEGLNYTLSDDDLKITPTL